LDAIKKQIFNLNGLNKTIGDLKNATLIGNSVLKFDFPNATANVKIDRLGRYPYVPTKWELLEKNAKVVGQNDKFSLLIDQDDMDTIQKIENGKVKSIKVMELEEEVNSMDLEENLLGE
jgi:hypothetical protein